MKWVIVITGLDCDDTTILETRDRLIQHIHVPHDGTLTMKAWLFADYWLVSPPPMRETKLPPDERIVREVLST